MYHLLSVRPSMVFCLCTKYLLQCLFVMHCPSWRPKSLKHSCLSINKKYNKFWLHQNLFLFLWKYIIYIDEFAWFERYLKWINYPSEVWIFDGGFEREMWTNYSDKILWKMIALVYSFIKHWLNAYYMLGVRLGVGTRMKQGKREKRRNLTVSSYNYGVFPPYPSLNISSLYLITYSSPSVSHLKLFSVKLWIYDPLTLRCSSKEIY